MSDFKVTGADDFLKLSKGLKRSGNKPLRAKLNAGLKDTTRTLIPKAQQALADGLPADLRARGANVKQVVQVRTGADPGVRIAVRYGKRGRGLGASNARLANRAGLIRHPVFGNRERWVNTRVPRARDWFDGTYARSAPLIRPRLQRVLKDVADEVVREAKRG